MPPRRRPLFTSTAAIEERIVLALLDTANHLQRRGEELAASVGLTTQQWIVLLQIARDPAFPGGSSEPGGVLASEIAAARGLSRATLSITISQLKSRALVTEVRDPADRRRRTLQPTAAALGLLERIEPTRRAANRRLLAELTAQERAMFLRCLDRCLAVLWEVHEDRQLATRIRRVTAR